MNIIYFFVYRNPKNFVKHCGLCLPHISSVFLPKIDENRRKTIQMGPIRKMNAYFAIDVRFTSSEAY